MSADATQVNYQQLETIARRFGAEGETIAEITLRLRDEVECLCAREWRGHAAECFEKEMLTRVLPAMQRLAAALVEAGEKAGTIGKIYREHEEEAAGLFRGEAGLEQSSHSDTRPAFTPGQHPTERMHVTEIPPRDYAIFSGLAYDDHPVVPQELARKGWEYYTNVYDALGKDRTRLDDYFGAVFINRQTGEMVVAHRGTEPFHIGLSSDLDDDAELAAGRIPGQYRVSRDFLEAVQTKMARDGLTNFGVVHTGHSLGAALSDLNGLKDGVKSISFDNPGVMNILKNNMNEFNIGERSNLINYQSNPNLVHWGGQPAGYSVQFIPKDGGSNLERVLERASFAMNPVNGAFNVLAYTVKHHDLSNIVNSFDPNTGFPYAQFPVDGAKVDHGWWNLSLFHQGKVEGAYTPGYACFEPPPLN